MAHVIGEWSSLSGRSRCTIRLGQRHVRPLVPDRGGAGGVWRRRLHALSAGVVGVCKSAPVAWERDAAARAQVDTAVCNLGGGICSGCACMR